MKIRVFWLTLVLLGCVGLVAIAEPTGTLRVAQDTDAVTADPHVNIYVYSTLLQRGPYETLVRVDETGGTTPMLAESWEVSEDSLEYTFHLRSDVAFSDGSPFDAEAVRYNFDRDMGLALDGARYLPPGLTVVVVDDLTIKFVLADPFAPFLSTLDTVHMISPTAARSHEVDGDWGRSWLDVNPVGTGPYLLDRWEKDEFYVLSYNPNYWKGWDGQHPETIVVRIIPEQSTRLQLLLNGEVDVAFKIVDDAFLKTLESNPAFKAEPQKSGEVLYLRMKSRGAFEDKRVREAMLYILPYSSFWADVVRGRGATVQGFISPAIFGYDETLPEGHQDLSRARALLLEAGYSSGLSIELWTLSSFLPIVKPLSELFKEEAAKVGVNVEIVDIASVATFLGGVSNTDVNEGPDMWSWTQSPGINSPWGAPLGMWYSENTPPGRNGEFYSNGAYDALYVEAGRTADPVARAAMYSEMQRILLGDPPAVPVGTWKMYLCMTQSVNGIALGSAGSIIDWYSVSLDGE